MTSSETKASRRPLLIITVIFIIVTVIVGAVVWKLTKDAYETKSSSTQDNGDSQGSKGNGTDPDNEGDGGDKGKGGLTEEEDLRLHPWKILRLPRNILPVHYDITMYPDFYEDHAEFYGNETIELNITSPAQYIFIHIKTDYVNISDTKVFDNSTDEALGVNRTFVYEPNEFFVIEAEAQFDGLVRVHLQFEGVLNKSIVGIYKSSYVNSLTNQTVHLATSKFEPTFARRAFPCLDEPNMKATYSVTLVHRPGYTALSNMDVQSIAVSEIDSQLRATRFHRSVKMSTYLVCFIVCDFKSIETISSRGTQIRVFSTPDKTDQIDYALRMAKHTLDFYEQLFQIHYPLPKQDLIAIPDFVSGAMEHWGLITFRETALLYNVNRSTLSTKKRVATVVAHEMAHQWFGNLVTMDWWNDLWLNEGFASYMEYVGAGTEEKDWDLMSMFLLDDLLRVTDDDAVLNSHPIVVRVDNPTEITSVFDSISYSKGSSVIRMLHGIMGDKDFFQGIANYLKKYMWGNAKTDDLWNSLSQVVPSLDVKEVMDTWTLQDGYPYVNVSVLEVDGGKTRLRATQTRFLSDANAVLDPKSSPLGYKWYIYLDYNTSTGNSGLSIMNNNNTLFEVNEDLSQDGVWIKFNKDKTGFYRVLYPEPLWMRLAHYLNTTAPEDWLLSPSDRADILNDAFNFASAGLLPYRIPLTLTSYLPEESHYVPWRSALGCMSKIRGFLKGEPEKTAWKKYRLHTVEKPLAKLGYEDKGTFLERSLRSELFGVACSYGDDTARENVHHQFRQWLDNDVMPSVNLRGVVYNYGMLLNGTEADWNKVWDKYTVETSPSEKSLLLKCLASTQNSDLISNLLEKARLQQGIRTQDFFTAVGLLGLNAEDVVWAWIKKYYTEFEKRFSVNDRSFGRMAYKLVRNFHTKEKLKEVQEFFSDHPQEGSSARYRKMAVEDINRNIDWVEKYLPDVTDWIMTLT